MYGESGTSLVAICSPPSLPSLVPPFSVLEQITGCELEQYDCAAKLISAGVSAAHVFALLRIPVITRASVRQATLYMTRHQLFRKIWM